MQTQHPWRLRHWIIVGNSVPIVALVVSAIATVINVNIVGEHFKSWQHISDVDGVNRELEYNIQVGAATFQEYLITERLPILDEYLESMDNAEKAIHELRKSELDTQYHQRLDQVEKLLHELNTSNQSFIQLIQDGKAQQAVDQWDNSPSHQITDSLTALMRELETSQDQLITDIARQEEDALSQLKTILLLSTGLSILLSIGIGFLIVQQASRQMTKSASAIASAATEIAATLEQQERIANHQAVSVNQTTTTMDELGASSRQSADQVESAAVSAEQARLLSENGTKAVHQTLTGMTELRQKVEAISDQISRLNEQTNQIGTISSLVGDLANQTNMLALNAAVEAVRAGEHGKGFAVVAEEIRKLADESKKSSLKISGLVNDIQTALRSTVSASDEGTKTVEEGVRVAEDTSESFVGVANAINIVTLNSQQISLNIKQQAIAIEQVVQTMNALNLAARESAAGVSQIKGGIHQLNQAALDLKAIV